MASWKVVLRWIAIPCCAAAVLLSPQSAKAASISLTVRTVTGLSNAFASAEANPGNFYTVRLVSSRYALTQRLSLTKGNITLNGNESNPSACVIDGQNGNFPVFQVDGNAGGNPVLNLYGITITGGRASDGTLYTGGGGVRNLKGDVSIVNCVIRKNKANLWGGGIFSTGGWLYVSGSLVDSNSNTQGTQCNQGGQTAFGGGIGAVGGYTTIVRSTIKNNAACRGGGIAAGGSGSFYLENSTLSADTAYAQGGGLFLYGATGEVILHFNTIAYNVAGSYNTGSAWRYGGGLGITALTGNIQVFGNIIAKNTVTFPDSKLVWYDGRDCYADQNNTQSAKKSGNVVGVVDNCDYYLGSSSQVDGRIGWSGNPTDPRLQPLANNGWGTYGFAMPTHMPYSDSRAVQGYYPGVGYANYEYCPTIDQRAWYRPNVWATHPFCDIGAVEYGGVNN